MEDKAVYCKTRIEHDNALNNRAMMARCLKFMAGAAGILHESMKLNACKVKLTPDDGNPAFIEVIIDMTSKDGIEATKSLMEVDLPLAVPCTAEAWLITY